MRKGLKSTIEHYNIGGKKCWFFGKLCVSIKWITPNRNNGMYLSYLCSVSYIFTITNSTGSENNLTNIKTIEYWPWNKKNNFFLVYIRKCFYICLQMFLILHTNNKNSLFPHFWYFCLCIITCNIWRTGYKINWEWRC